MIAESPPSVITLELIARIKAQYRLDWYGVHGIRHWHRVYQNGMKLAEQEGVNVKVVMLFAILHDSCRKNENRDADHGRRGAELTIKLREYCPLGDAEFGLLTTACELHTGTPNHTNLTIAACFDADRSDLYRVGITPDPERLCTPIAKTQDFIEWASYNSIHDNDLPENPFGINSELEEETGC